MDEYTVKVFEITEQVRNIVRDSDEHELGEFSGKIERQALQADAENPAQDARDAAFIYGLSYGLLRAKSTDCPNEEELEELRDLAYDVAEEAYRRWNAPPTRREVRESTIAKQIRNRDAQINSEVRAEAEYEAWHAAGEGDNRPASGAS